jgi:hypothetical protein
MGIGRGGGRAGRGEMSGLGADRRMAVVRRGQMSGIGGVGGGSDGRWRGRVLWDDGLVMRVRGGVGILGSGIVGAETEMGRRLRIGGGHIGRRRRWWRRRSGGGRRKGGWRGGRH